MFVDGNFLDIDDSSQLILDGLRSNGTDVVDAPQQQLDIYPGLVDTPSQVSNPGGGVEDPLVPTPDGNILEWVSPVEKGLVCDGVTPLTLRFEALDALSTAVTSLQCKISLRSVSGGSVTDNLASHLFVLSNGQWVSAAEGAIVDMTNPNSIDHHSSVDVEAFAYISAIPAESLQLDNGSKEVVFEITAQMKDSQNNDMGSLQKITLRLRKPPVVLVHGYNSDNGTWSSLFLNELKTTRADDFVLPVQYGVAGDLIDNTTGRLDALAQLLDQKLAAQVEDSASLAAWAWTRYDVVGHSQGGVLLRMLCTQWPVFSQTPFLGPENLYRGRFRRILTIGSPHNGSVILHYLLEMKSRSQGNRGALIRLRMLETLLQSKFDPFGEQIAKINNPVYAITPAAKFHAIRTTIPQTSINPAGTFVFPSIYSAVTGFNEILPPYASKTRGDVVLQGRGSDAIVDFDSQGGGSGTPSSYLPAPSLAHADAEAYGFNLTLELFGVLAGATQTASASMGQRVIGLLDGPASAFGPFVLPSLLDADRRAEIDGAIPEVVSSGSVMPSSGSGLSGSSLAASAQGAAPSSYQFTRIPSTSEPIQSVVTWIATVFGPAGASQNGVTVQTDATDSTRVTVTVDPTVRGDVVLYSSYYSTNNKLVYSEPTLVASNPLGSSLTSIELRPASFVLLPGETQQLEVWGTYDSATTGQFFLPAAGNGEFEFSSSNSSVMTVDGNGLLIAQAEGVASVTVSHNGLTATSDISVGKPVPIVTGGSNIIAVRGQSMQFQVTATNDPTGFGATGFPNGLGIDNLSGLISGTPSNPGVFTASVIARNQSGISSSQSISITVFTPYQNWKFQNFGDSSVDDLGNPSGDGISNLVKYATGMDPSKPGIMPGRASRVGSNMEFTYTRSVEALNAGAVFTVEWSDTLANDWQTTGVSEAILSSDGTVQEVKATLPAGNAGHRFIHLKVTVPP